MSMSASTLSKTSVKLTTLGSSEFHIQIYAGIKVSQYMYELGKGEYKYGVEVGGVLIPATTEAQAKGIAEKMAGLIMNVALEARKA